MWDHLLFGKVVDYWWIIWTWKMRNQTQAAFRKTDRTVWRCWDWFLSRLACIFMHVRWSYRVKYLFIWVDILQFANNYRFNENDQVCHSFSCLKHLWTRSLIVKSIYARHTLSKQSTNYRKGQITEPWVWWGFCCCLFGFGMKHGSGKHSRLEISFLLCHQIDLMTYILLNPNRFIVKLRDILHHFTILHVSLQSAEKYKAWFKLAYKNVIISPSSPHQPWSPRIGL